MPALHMGADVEPQDAVLVADDAVASGHDAAAIRHREMFHRAGLGVDPGVGRDAAGTRVDDPDVAVEIGGRVVHAGHVSAFGRRAEHPVAAVVGLDVIVLGREVVFPHDNARSLAGRARPQIEPHRALARSARPREIGGEFLLVKVDIGRDPLVRARIGAADVHLLHQVEDFRPAFLVEAVLQGIAGAVTAGAVLAHLRLHAEVFRRIAGERRQEFVARQLLDPGLPVGDRLEHEVLLPRLADGHVVARGLELHRLRPDPIVSVRQRREVVVAGRVGIDAGGDGRAIGLRRHGHATHSFAGGGGDGAGERRVGIGGQGRQCRRAERDGDGDQADACETAGVCHVRSHWRSPE